MENLDVIIPLCNLVPTSLRSRVDTLNYAMKQFYVGQHDVHLTLIFVEQSLDGKIYYLDNLEIPTGIDVKKVEIQYPNFNKPWCLNVGFKRGDSPFVMFADSDIVAYDDYFGRAVKWLMDKNFKWCFAWNKLYYADYLEKREVVYLGKDRFKHIDTTFFKPSRGVNEGGFVLYRRAFYEAIGMGNEFFEQLGGPDNEQAMRATHVSKTYEMFDQLIYHLEHEQTNKSARPERKRNIMMYRAEAKDMDKAVRLLRGLEPGGNEPYCATKKFETVFDVVLAL